MDQDKHISVLLEQSIELLEIKKDGIYVDCTLGRGGHSKAILAKLTTGKLYCFEQDGDAIKESIPILTTVSNNFKIIKSNFNNLKQELQRENINAVDGIIYDLGVCSTQLDQPERGFSFHKEGLLDMRMDQNQDLTAAVIVNTYSEKELIKILRDYGEEQWANLIVKAIINYRTKIKITTTTQLVDIIKMALPAKVLRKNQHPARKTFQSLRIAVNNELLVLQNSLQQALQLLKHDGIIVVISFHSLEDRIVKKVFNQAIIDPQAEIKRKIFIDDNWKPAYQILTRKVITPSESEINNNSRARSAKLRAIKKIGRWKDD